MGVEIELDYQAIEKLTQSMKNAAVSTMSQLYGNLVDNAKTMPFDTGDMQDNQTFASVEGDDTVNGQDVIDIEQSNPIVMVNCEVAFDTRSDNHRYFINKKVWCVRDGRTVTGECFLENSDNKTRHFKMNIYCLVIYTTDGSQGIE